MATKYRLKEICRIRLYKFIGVTQACILGLALSSCSKTYPISKTLLMLDTVIKISIYDGKAETLDNAFDVCKKYEDMLSKTIPTSDVFKINQNGTTPTDINPHTAELIKKSIYYSQISDGIFDVTVGGLINLWDFNRPDGDYSLPDDSNIKTCLKGVGWDKIVFESEQSLRLANEKTSLDLGGIAKGYIADKISEDLKQNGVTSAVISLGGNILTIGEKPDGNPWTIAIQKPFSETGEKLAKLSVGEKSIVSSGIYERYFTNGGRIYHHIIDPKTGYPINTDVVSVTIVSDKSVDGDALSTIALGLGLENGMALIESMENTDAVFVTTDNKVYYTAGFIEKYDFQILDEGYTLALRLGNGS